MVLDIENDNTRALFEALSHARKRNGVVQRITSASAAGLDLSPAKRGAIIAALWASRSRDTLRHILSREEFREQAALSAAMRLLDIPRRIRQLERKLPTLNARKQRALRNQLNDLRNEDVPAAYSCSRSFGKILGRLLGDMSPDRLEFDLLFYENGPWKGFCDVAHLSPKAWKLDYFQPTVFGAAPPAGSFLSDARGLNKENLPELLDKHELLAECFSFIRLKIPALDDRCKVALARRGPLSDLLWHYDQVRCGGADDVITERLCAGANLQGGHLKADNFAKIMEKLIVFRQQRVPFWKLLMPLADEMLDSLKARRLALVERSGPRSLQSLAALALADPSVVPEAVALSVPADTSLKVAVLGDASASMQVCVTAASICGAIMASIFEAELVFFNRQAFRSQRHQTPKTADEVLAVTEEVRASMQTSPASALFEFYNKKQPVDLFICVTDEEENTAHDGHSLWGSMHNLDRDEQLARQGHYSFASLWAKYVAEVHADAKCVFVSFLRSAAADEGQMVHALKARGFGPAQYKFDQSRPDLSKFDALLGLVLLEASAALDAQQPPAAAG